MTVNGEPAEQLSVDVTQHMERDLEGNRVPGNMDIEVQARFSLTQVDVVYQCYKHAVQIVLDDGSTGSGYIRRWLVDRRGVLVWLVGSGPFVQPS